MTVSTISGYRIPQWDIYDRMTKSLKESGMSVQEVADYYDVHRNTVSGWLHGRIKPDTRTLRLWAVMTGVPYEWLKDGTEPPGPQDPDGGGLLLPRMDSNHQPSDLAAFAQRKRRYGTLDPKTRHAA